MATLDEYMALPWRPFVDVNAAGDNCVTVRELPDFRFYFESAADSAHWHDALRAHLESYVKAGEAIPEPAVPVFQEPEIRDTYNDIPWQQFEMTGQMSHRMPLEEFMAAA